MVDEKDWKVLFTFITNCLLILDFAILFVSSLSQNGRQHTMILDQKETDSPTQVLVSVAFGGF